jgi:hypothetical protein
VGQIKDMHDAVRRNPTLDRLRDRIARIAYELERGDLSRTLAASDLRRLVKASG